MSYTLENFYKQTLSLDWSIGTGTFYVAVKPTISTGWLVISPNNATTREIIKYTSTGTDANGDYVVVSVRGVGGTTEQTHTVGEPIRMNITAEYWDAMNDDIAAIVASGVTNMTTTSMGGGQLATAPEIDALTENSAGGVPLLINPKLLGDAHNIPHAAPGTSGNILQSNGTDWASVADNSKQYTVGALDNALVKTYFNWQLHFIIATGSVSGAATTDFSNWIRSSTDVGIDAGYGFCSLQALGADSIYISSLSRAPVQFTSTNIVIADWWAKLPATSTGDLNMGFFATTGDLTSVYNSSTGGGKVAFTFQGSTGKIFATVFKNGVGISQTEITGITNTVYNNFRIEFDVSNNALFYINGVLKVTLPSTNLPTAGEIYLGFGRSDSANVTITAPNLSVQMNP